MSHGVLMEPLWQVSIYHLDRGNRVDKLSKFLLKFQQGARARRLFWW